MHNNWIRKNYKLKVKEHSFYFNPWTIEYERYDVSGIVMSRYNKYIRFNFNTESKILLLLDNVIGHEITISYFINLKEERKLKLQKLNESR